MVRLAPDGRRRTATAPKVFGHVFDTVDSSGPLTATPGRPATLLGGCVGIVGRLGDDRVLCRTRSGSFRSVDARSGRDGIETPLTHPDDGLSYDSSIAEGALVSADGERFIASVHLPDKRFGDPGDDRADFRVVPTSGEGTAVPVSHVFLSDDTVFLEWW